MAQDRDAAPKRSVAGSVCTDTHRCMPGDSPAETPHNPRDPVRCGPCHGDPVTRVSGLSDGGPRCTFPCTPDAEERCVTSRDAPPASRSRRVDWPLYGSAAECCDDAGSAATRSSYPDDQTGRTTYARRPVTADRDRTPASWHHRSHSPAVAPRAIHLAAHAPVVPAACVAESDATRRLPPGP